MYPSGISNPVNKIKNTAGAYIKTSFEFYIATNGFSSNKGTQGNPFSNLEDAKKAIRQLKNMNQLNGGTVWLREGIYELPQSFLLEKDDSGTANDPIIFTAYPGEKGTTFLKT